MEWIERIDDVDGTLKPVYITKDGQRTYGSLKQCKSRMTSSGYQAAVVRDLSLQSLYKVDSTAYLEAMGFAEADSTGQDVFAADCDGIRIHLPTSVLLLALVSRFARLGDHLLRASAMTALMRPIVRDGQLVVAIQDRFIQTSVLQLPIVQSRLQWLTGFASARRMWSSVYEGARRGTLSLELPKASVAASVVGFQRDGNVYASRLSIKELRPDEEPLPFAAPYVPDRFVIRQNVDRAGLKAFQASGNHSNISSDDSIPAGPRGWAMTNDEWRQVRELLKARGYSTQRTSNVGLNMALEKYGAGVRWRSLVGNIAVAQSVVFRWKESGKWQDFVAALQQVRSSETAPVQV